MRKENIINLIKYHAQKNDVAFNNEVQLIARSFEKNGDTELAHHVLALISRHNVFTSPEIHELKYFTEINLSTEALLLPDEILDDINGMIMAISKKRNVNLFLFSGASGTGKTESVKQIARILKKQLYSVNFSAIIDSKLGQSGKNINDLFDEMNHFSNRENVVFLFDEIDVLALNRIDSNDLREMGRVTSYMMKGLDNLGKDVMLFATTNLKESMDQALLRRFDAVIDFNRYNSKELLDIAEQMLVYSGEINDIKISNISLFRKIISLLNPIPYPGDLKNLINSSVAFSNPAVEGDYLHRLFKQVVSESSDECSEEMIQKLSDFGFTVHELEILTTRE